MVGADMEAERTVERKVETEQDVIMLSLLQNQKRQHEVQMKMLEILHDVLHNIVIKDK